MDKGISVIPKSAKPERLKENLGAVDVELEAADIEAIDGLEGQQGFGRMFKDPREFPGDNA